METSGVWFLKDCGLFRPPAVFVLSGQACFRNALEASDSRSRRWTCEDPPVKPAAPTALLPQWNWAFPHHHLKNMWYFLYYQHQFFRFLFKADVQIFFFTFILMFKGCREGLIKAAAAAAQSGQWCLHHSCLLVNNGTLLWAKRRPSLSVAQCEVTQLKVPMFEAKQVVPHQQFHCKQTLTFRLLWAFCVKF